MSFNAIESTHHYSFAQLRFFVIRAWRNDGIGLILILLVAGIALVNASMAFFEFSAARQAAKQETYKRTATAPNGYAQSVSTQLELVSFQSHQLPDVLNAASSALGLPVNEMVFRFDDNPLRPYLRYSATIKLFGGYPSVRKYVEAVRKTLPNTSLDAISCARSDIRSVHVSCELMLSTFYRRESGA